MITGEQHGQAHHDRVVARLYRRDEVLADPGDVEDQLDHERAGDDVAEQRPGRRDDRDQRVAQHVQADDAPVAQPLRACRAHVVLLQRLEHRPAHEPREERHRPEAERDRRQDLVLPGRPAARRQRTTLQRDEVDQQRRDQEARDRVEDVREDHRAVVDGGVVPERGDHPERDAEHDREEERVDAELDRLREVRLDDVVDVAAADDERRAEVERDDALDVVGVLDVPGLVEVELALEVALDGLRHRSLRLPERVALDLPHHHERQEDDDQDHRDRPEDAPDDELQHRLPLPASRRPRTAGGALRAPPAARVAAID